MILYIIQVFRGEGEKAISKDSVVVTICFREYFFLFLRFVVKKEESAFRIVHSFIQNSKIGQRLKCDNSIAAENCFNVLILQRKAVYGSL